MVVAAVIVGPGGRAPSPLTQFGGLSLIKRAVFTAQKAGVKTCYLYFDQEQEKIKHELQNDQRVTSQLVGSLQCRAKSLSVTSKGSASSSRPTQFFVIRQFRRLLTSLQSRRPLLLNPQAHRPLRLFQSRLCLLLSPKYSKESPGTKRPQCIRARASSLRLVVESFCSG